MRYCFPKITLFVLFWGIFINFNIDSVRADTLSAPATITNCYSELNSAGVYTLGNNIIASTSDPCITIIANGVIIDGGDNGSGGHFSITGNINGDAQTYGLNGFNFTLQNTSVFGTSTSNSIGNDDSCDSAGGNGGAITIINSTTTALISNGGIDGIACLGAGSGGNITITNSRISFIQSNGGNAASTSKDGLVSNGGNGGVISITSAGLLNLSNTIIDVSKGTGETSNGSNGSLLLSYNTLNKSNLFISALNNLTMNGPGNLPGNLGSFIGGILYISGDIINDCTNIAFTGIYILGGNINGNCILPINNITIDGNSKSILGNVIGNGYNFILQNITVTGSTTSNGLSGGNITISSSAVGSVSTNKTDDGSSGSAGNININNSITGSISANGIRWGISCSGCEPGSSHAGNINIINSTTSSVIADSQTGDGSVGGNITITGTNIDLSNKSMSATGSIKGTLTINYSVLDNTNLFLSALRDLVLNGPGNLPGDLGSFGGGILSLNNIITDISQCNLNISNSYILANDITGDCYIKSNNITIDGLGRHTIHGKIIGDATQNGNNGYNFSLRNITVDDSIISSGLYGVSGAGSGGSITIENSTTSNIFSNPGTCAFNEGVLCGSGGIVNVINSIVANVDVSAVDIPGYSRRFKGGNGGSIIISSSTAGSLFSNGANDDNQGGDGGNITINNSFEFIASSTIYAKGGNALRCGYGGNGGNITIGSSIFTGQINNNAGEDYNGYCTYPTSGTSGNSGNLSIISLYKSELYKITPIVPEVSNIITSAPINVSLSSGTPVKLVIATTTDISTSTLIAGSIKPNKPFFGGTITVQKILKTTDEVVNSAPSKSIQTIGFLTGIFGVASFYANAMFATPITVSELLLIPIRLWGLILMAFGLKKRIPPWGTVYDSVTKRPIDPAFVTARDKDGNIVAESMTDIDGRYGFLLPDGKYSIAVQKSNYEFPSKKLDGKIADEMYRDLYHGEEIVVSAGQIIDKNIPLDQENFDWNEEAKRKQDIGVFHKKYDKPFRIIGNYIFRIGLIISIIATIFNPSVYNIIIVSTYVLVFLFSHFSIKGKELGLVLDKNTNLPLAYAIFRVTSLDHQTILRSGVCDSMGRYYCIVPKGQYYLDIERKNEDGSYSKIYESDVLSGNNGIINKDFAV